MDALSRILCDVLPSSIPRPLSGLLLCRSLGPKDLTAKP
jgi:hypothetical protein